MCFVLRHAAVLLNLFYRKFFLLHGHNTLQDSGDDLSSFFTHPRAISDWQQIDLHGNLSRLTPPIRVA
jgi:hypothetical protein